MRDYWIAPDGRLMYLYHIVIRESSCHHRLLRLRTEGVSQNRAVDVVKQFVGYFGSRATPRGPLETSMIRAKTRHPAAD